MKNKNLPFYLGAIGLIICAAAFGWRSGVTKQIASGTIPMPNLDGDKARKYLEQTGLDKSLGEAVQTARYSVNRMENAPNQNRNAAFEAKNQQQDFAAYFTGDGVNLISREAGKNWNLSLKLKSFGRGAAQLAVGSRQWAVDKTKVSASHEIESEISNFKFQIKELFENKPEGLEQSFVIREKIEVQSPNTEYQSLKIVLSLSGDLQPEISADGQALIFTREGANVLRYDKLVSWDASGKELASRMELDGGELSLVVDDAAAVYPITIDPTFTQIKKLLASDGAANDGFGTSIAVSGNTAIVSAAGDNNARGAAYIFERNAGGANNWTQVKKLTASDGADGESFGLAVAIEDNTVVVGSERAAYIYGRNEGGAVNWGEVKILIEGVSEPGFYGNVLSLSGNTLFVGSSTNTPEFQAAPVFIYERDAGGANNWGLIKQLFLEGGTGSDSFPGAIGVSGDTAIVASNGSQGKAQIYRRDEGGANNWGRVKRILVSDNAFFSGVVGISGDTAVLGGLHIFGSEEVYVFGRNAGGADNWGLVKTITASDAAAQDWFGTTVGISGDRIIVGARLDDVGANADQGSAYIFERNQGGADNWGEIKKIVATDGAADDRFGFSVAIDGNTAFAGASLDDVGSNIEQGSAYAFIRQNTAWTQETKPLPANCTVDDTFGNTVAISGDTAIVGAFKADVGTTANQGAAYIFERNAGGANNWGLVKTLVSADGAVNNYFGSSVALSGDTAVVGSYSQNNIQGAAYVFERNAGGANNWGETKKLTASDGAGNHQFGFSVAINGDRLVVGAAGDTIGANFAQGSAYIFERNAGGANNWGEVKMLFAPDGAAFDQFGRSVAVGGNTVVVGAQFHDGAFQDQGSAYVFERNQGGAGNWGQTKKLSATVGGFLQQFGNSVAVSSDTIVVGAFSDKIGANIQQGAAYIFGRNTGGANNWGQVKKLVASDSGSYHFFGDSVVIEGDTVIVGSQCGSPAANGVCQGSAYIFKQNAGGANNWGETKKILASDRADYDRFGISVGISGDRVIIGALGDDVNGINGIGSSYIFVNTGADWIEQRKLLPPLPASCGATDNYGFSVAVSGDTAVIGAPGDDVGINTNQGSVYILERNQGGANNWGTVKLLTASDGAANDNFGISVAISGNSVMVGADGSPSGTNTAGSAYIFERNSGGTNNFGEVKKLSASDGVIGDRLGYSVAVSGNTAVVGAIRDNNSQGSAYIFERNAGGANNWGEIKKLVDAGGAANEFFGSSVAVKNDTVFVGSPSDSVGANASQGSVHIFERNAGGANFWARTKYLTVADGAFGDNFGWAIAGSGNLLIAAAPGDGIGEFTGEGSAYVFERNTGGAENWGQVKKIRATDAGQQDQFGRAVGISGDAAIVGSPYDDVGANADQGSAYIFEQNAGGASNWGQVTKLTATNGAAGDLFGYSVAASGDNFLVGAHLANAPTFTGKQSNNSFGGNTKGASYVFRGSTLSTTAASVSVSGRVLTANGRGVSRAVITLTGANGETRRAISNPFGYYRFADVPSGATYVFSVSHKRYIFSQSTQVRTIVEETDDVIFTADN